MNEGDLTFSKIQGHLLQIYSSGPYLNKQL